MMMTGVAFTVGQLNNANFMETNEQHALVDVVCTYSRITGAWYLQCSIWEVNYLVAHLWKHLDPWWWEQHFR